MEEPTDVKVDVREEDAISRVQAMSSPIENKRMKNWSWRSIIFGAFMGFAFAVTCLVNVGNSPTHASQGASSNTRAAERFLSRVVSPRERLEATQKVQPRQQAPPSLYKVDYLVDWNASGDGCEVPSASLGARCGEGAVLYLPEHNRSAYTCRPSLGRDGDNATVSFSCSDSSNGTIIIRCESLDEDSLTLSVHWYGDHLECSENGTAIQILQLRALDPDVDEPVEVIERVCLGNLDPALWEPKCRGSRCLFDMGVCHSSVFCQDGGECIISGVMVTTLGTSFL
jgi:hypothetical protein